MKNLTKVQELKSVERDLKNLLTGFCENNYKELTADEKIECLDKVLREMEKCFAKATELQDSSSIWFRFRTVLTNAKIDLHKQSYINLHCELRVVKTLKELGEN
jgi:hypothetical protein